tara:strand:- start:1152 stop:1946 length:795 start_codon:yes stop_codon:yes gene_type:complete
MLVSDIECERPTRIPLHITGALERLPAAPQSPFLRSLAQQLLAYPDVAELWLRGSLARGDWDRFSDIDLDLHLHSPPWPAEQLRPLLPRGLLSVREATRAGVASAFEAVFEGGVIVDLDVHAERLGASSGQSGAARWSHRYWVSVLKARKLVAREQLMVAQLGLGYQRGLVLGAMAQRAGIDVGDPQALNIYALGTLLGKLALPVATDWAEVMGWPSRNQGEFLGAIDSLNAVMAALELGASTLGSAVRMLWAGRDYLPGQAPQ